MPYLNIQTNLPLTEKAEDAILRSASSVLARELDKPESYVMIALEPDTPMFFAGTDDPAAFLELKSIGLPTGKTRKLSEALSKLLHDHLGIANDRVYVTFHDLEGDKWGWKGDVF